MSRWAERFGFDRGDVRFLLGLGLLAGGIGWATAPGWGVAAAGFLVVTPSFVEWVAVLVPRKGD